MAEITLKNGEYTVKFDYDRVLVALIKALPFSGRKWDAAEKVWKVDSKHEKQLRDIFPDEVIPAPTLEIRKPERYNVNLRYLGQAKYRDDGTKSSYGYSRNTWSVVFPESVLIEWFEGTDEKPKIDTTTLYGIIGVNKYATSDEIKTGYRRMAKQWHPDLCKEKDAEKVFLQIKEAYDTLSDSGKKTRYDVGLQFEDRNGSKKKKKHDAYEDGYRAPLRCGTISVEAVETLGRLIVSKIYSWDDIVDEYGRTLVTSWIMGDDKPIEIWS